jgi:PEP-CTERM motif
MLGNSVSRCLATLSFVAIATNSWAGTVYDPAADFEQGWTTQSNPNGVWSYGYSSGFANPVTLYNQTQLGPLNGPYAQYWLSSSVDTGESPSAEFNNGPAYANGNINFLANEFLLVAGIGGQYSDLVFTAPADGIYSVVTSFRGAQNVIGTVVGVVANGTLLFDSSVTAVGQTVPFDTEVSLTAGDTVVFSVGPGGGAQNTGLSATITTVPEPGTYALLLVGLGLVGWGTRRRG